MGKKPAAAKKVFNMAQLAVEFGGDPTQNLLPHFSSGKDFAKGKGKHFRDDDGRGGDSEWRSGGKGGFGKGSRDEPSRSDNTDWRGGGGDRGGFERGSGGGGMRRDDRRGDDNAASNRDSDWRGNAGFSRDGPKDAPSERPRLQLQKRTKPLPEGESQDKVGDDDRRGGLPQRGDRDRDEKDNKDDWETVKKAPGATKYVPPHAKKRDEGDRDDRRQGGDFRREEEAGRRLGASGNGGKFVPPQRRAEEEEQRKRDEAKAKEKADAEKRRRLEEEEKAEAERASKRDKKERKEEEKAKARKEATKARATVTEEDTKSSRKDGACPEILAEFAEEVAAMMKSKKINIEDRAKDAVGVLTEAELKTVQPISLLVAPILAYCRGKTEEEVFAEVARFQPIFTELIEGANVHRFKVKVLTEVQRLAYEIGLPRLSPASALLEAFFDGLYRAEIIEEGYFNMWAINDDDTPGRTSAMFQVSCFLDFLRDALVEGESDDEEGPEEADHSDTEEEGEDSDIEAYVPQRRH